MYDLVTSLCQFGQCDEESEFLHGLLISFPSYSRYSRIDEIEDNVYARLLSTESTWVLNCLLTAEKEKMCDIRVWSKTFGVLDDKIEGFKMGVGRTLGPRLTLAAATGALEELVLSAPNAVIFADATAKSGDCADKNHDIVGQIEEL